MIASLPRLPPFASRYIAKQDKRLNIWSIATGRHVRGYKVENPAGSPTPAAAAAAGGAGVVGMSGGGAGGGGGRGGGELLKVDLDPTGMYAAACSFDKVRGFVVAVAPV